MISTTQFEIVAKNQVEPITIYVRDTITNDLVDVAGTSTWTLVNIADDTTVDSGTFDAAGSTEMVRVGEGIYQYAFDAHANAAEYVLFVNCTLANETVKINLFVKSVASRLFAYASQLRLQVDKARKSIKDDIENMDRSSENFDPSIQFYYGFSDSHLIFYLERGAQFLNAIPPYTGMTAETFPFTQYGTILIDAATIAALESQGVFAIDTDFNYSLGGNSLVINHYAQLSQQVSAILARFTKTAVSWKQQYRTKGGVLYQFTPGGIRSARMYNSLPGSFWSRVMSSVMQG
jgi:hypothetical protein